MNIWNQNVPRPSNISVSLNRSDMQHICHLTSQKTAKHTGISAKSLTPEMWVIFIREKLVHFEEYLKKNNKSIIFEMQCMVAYLFHTKYLKDKYLNEMNKIKRCLMRWKKLNLEKILENVIGLIPDSFYIIKEIRLPSPKMLYHLLHRLIGSFYLFNKCYWYCVKAGENLKMKLTMGHFIRSSMFGMGLVGKISSLSLGLTSEIASLSDELHPYFMSLIETKNIATEKLPQNLKVENDRLVALLSKNNADDKVSVPKRSLFFDEDLEGHHFKLVSKEREYESNDITSLKLKSISMDNDAQDEGRISGRSQKLVTSKNDVEEEYDDDDDDIGEYVSQSKFEELKKLSASVIEGPKDKKRKRDTLLSKAGNISSKNNALNVNSKKNKNKKSKRKKNKQNS